MTATPVFATVLTVPEGGTGRGTFAPNLLVVGSSTATGGLQSTSSPTIGYFTATSTTASSTVANGINIFAGCFALNGTCVGGSGLTGSGTQGQATYWTGSGSLGSVATGTVSSSGGITITAGRSVFGGALSIICDIA